jgi:aldose 1-epimerase
VDADDTLELRNSTAMVSIAPGRGGRIAQLRVRGRSLLVDDRSLGEVSWGSYPMVPWAGRIGNAQFTLDGQVVQLEANAGPHAMHGVGFAQPWTVQDAGAAHLSMSTELRWPLGGHAHQHIELGEHTLRCTLTVTAAEQRMPVTIGWHPWFVKPERAELRFEAMYERGPHHLPTGRLVAPAAEGSRDDCFVRPAGALRLHYPSLAVVVDSDCECWVVFDTPAHATCVEPQSGPPDAVNLGAAALLDTHQSLTRTMSLTWS